LEETLRALRHGEVDALVVYTPGGDRVFTLQGADHPYRVMVETINEGAATLSPYGQILYANLRLAEMLAAPLESLMGARLHDLIEPMECPTLDELLECAQRVPQREECVVRVFNGKSIPACLSMSPLPGLEFQAICMIVTDLTEHRNRQVQLSRTNELLKAEIAERKRVESALRQLTGRLLRLQDEERRRIARDLHDSTAQTLNGLVLNLAYLQSQSKKQNSGSPKLLAESIALAEQAATEVRNLSHLLYPPALDQMGLMAAIQSHTARTSEISGIAISHELPADMPRLPREIEVALFRVLQESLENVRRHSGSPVASVRLARQDNEVLLEIEDQGRGFSPERLLRSEPNSNGLGVAGMRERLRQLGGNLQIASGARGTRVKAVVPLGGRKASGKPRRGEPPLRVLIVDDSAAVRGGVRALLEDSDYLEFVGEAANGREAIEKAVELQPDLILLDIAMPEMDGLEAARQLSTVAPRVRILALSQNESPHTVREAQKAGALGYVLKSDAAQDLLPAIRAVGEGKTFFSSSIARGKHGLKAG
jgi:PAS domain S-box-containing protein